MSTISGSSSTISSVSSSESTTTATKTLKSAKSSTIDYDQFLQLLIAELKYQDPTNPTDPTEHVSQLASFSAVEQQVKTNTVLSSLLAAESNQIIGKSVTSADGLESGVVDAVTIGSDNSISATLKDGSTVVLGSGIKISGS
jgi:flagellar basal-body rod modification protein FlgD